jgi:transcriptional regulator with XRE-family HTH domain
MQMAIGERLRNLRKEKKLSQKDIGERTGLPQSYLSLVENGHTTPGIQTLEKLARALGIQMYQLFHDGAPPSEYTASAEAAAPAETGAPGNATNSIDRSLLTRLHHLLGRIDESDRRLLFSIAEEMANR